MFGNHGLLIEQSLFVEQLAQHIRFYRQREDPFGVYRIGGVVQQIIANVASYSEVMARLTPYGFFHVCGEVIERYADIHHKRAEHDFKVQYKRGLIFIHQFQKYELSYDFYVGDDRLLVFEVPLLESEQKLFFLPDVAMDLYKAAK